MADKDVDGVIAALVRSKALDGATVVATSLDVARAMPAAELAARWRTGVVWGERVSRPRQVIAEPDARRALERALAEPGPVVVAGSLYLVGEVRGALVDDPALRDPDPARGHMTDTPRPPLPEPSRIGPGTFRWGERTFVMGILNVTPDSFSGDGLLTESEGERGDGAGAPDPIEIAVATGRRMVEEGADILDVGGESTRPGHEPVAADEERRRVVPVIAALRAALPDTPLSIDTTKPAVAEAALAAGADLVNDVWGVGDDDTLARLAADHGVPLVVMHNRAEARYTTFIPELIADLQRAIERALGLGVRWDDLIVDPGFGFGKTAEHNLELMRELGTLTHARPADPARREPQVDPRPHPRPAGRRAAGGDAGHDRPRDRRRRRYRPRPRCRAPTSARRG